MAQRIAVRPKAGTLGPTYTKSYDADVPSSLEYPRVSLHAVSRKVFAAATLLTGFEVWPSWLWLNLTLSQQ